MNQTTSLFGWITTRCEQAVAEGINREDAVRMLELSPSPGDVAVIHSILTPLADHVKIDWARPLMDWSKSEMTDFLLQAWLLANNAETVLADQAILRKKTTDNECSHGMPRALCRQCRRTKKTIVKSLYEESVRIGAGAVARRRSDPIAALGTEGIVEAAWHEVRRHSRG
jgi:hypothetical protein